MIDVKDRRLWFAGVILVLVAAGRLLDAIPRRREDWRYRVKVGDLRNTVEASGLVMPQNRVEILPPVDGRVETILADQGQRVQRNGILAWMSSADRAAILDAAASQGPSVRKRWEDDYHPTPVLAPVGGVVIERNVVVGQTVARGKALFVLSDRLIVKARVDESEIANIRPRQSAVVVTDAFPKLPFNARVKLIGYQSRDAGGVSAYDVELEPAAAPDGLRSGMTARVEFLVGERKGVLLLPKAAVGDARDSGLELRTVTPDGETKRLVRLGVSDGANVEVVQGLSAGDEVLVEAPDFSAKNARAER